MAYAALVSLSQTLLQEVTYDDQHQIKSLHDNLCFLQAFLEEYAGNSGASVESLEARIREAVHLGEDVVEIHISNQFLSRYLVSKNGQTQDNANRSYEDFQKMYIENLQRVIEQIDSIVEELNERKRSQRIEDLTTHPADGSSMQIPMSCGSTMVGFNDELLEMKARLCGESSELHIISVLGMGGRGKTTLAKTIFDDSLVAYHFDVHAWITISQEYCIQGILLSLLSSLNSATTDDLSKKSDEILAEHVYKSLKGRRYFIVMDDMCSTKAWDDVRRILPDDNNGSRVIITSRLSEVATYADPSSTPQQMQLLDEDQSWTLLKQKVFAHECCPPELENIGKMIAGKCRGLPLTIVLVAGLLSDVRIVNHWEKFAINVSSNLATNDEHLFKILSLSYNNLPHHLRACFLYMGGFPEDSEILISRLTKLWTAEGFLKPVISKSFEEVAEEYVLDLVKRNLISVTKKSSNGKFRLCHIHDILRDFCIRTAQNENFLHVANSDNTSQEGIESKRRFSCSVCRYIPSTQRGVLVRSVLLFNKKYCRRFSIFFGLLKVFSGTNMNLDLLHPAVTKLFHLRYLSFSYNSVKFVVPASISELRNLQTLIIQFSGSGVEWLKVKLCFPSEIWEMPKLRHIIVHNYCILPDVPYDGEFGGNTCGLKNLQTLSKVGNFSFTREITERIPNLKKLAVVYYTDDSIDPPEVHFIMHQGVHDEEDKKNNNFSDKLFTKNAYSKIYKRMKSKLGNRITSYKERIITSK